MADPLTITVDGRRVDAEPGETLLTVLRRLGVRIPTLCHDDRLTPYGGCRLCVVHRKDSRPGLVPACSTPVQAGMVIETDTVEVVESRRRQLQILALSHRLECPVCERHGDCRFQDLLHEIGIPDDRPPFTPPPGRRDESWPIIVRDPEKCVVCGRCVRLCDEVQGVSAIGFVGRGLEVRVATFLDRPLDCEFCGQCVNACPSAALLARPFGSEVPTWLRARATTTCSLCSCGCQVVVESFDGRVVRVTGDESSSPNRGKLCAKGWLGWDILSSPERLATPLVRRGGRLEEASWEEALDRASRHLADARAAGSAVGVVGSARLTSEDAWTLQWLARAVLRTPHVTTGPTPGVRALVEGVRPVLGRARSTAGLPQLAAADLVLVLRGDPTRTHPLVKTELVQGVRQRQRPVILAATLFGGLERHAERVLELAPGSEAVLCRTLAAEILERRPELLRGLGSSPGFGLFADALAAYRGAAARRLVGCDPEAIDAVAARLAQASRPVVVLVCGRGLPGDEGDAARAAAELAAVVGGGLTVLGGAANVQGVLDAGLHPALLPGEADVSDPDARRRLAAAWGVALPDAGGWGPGELFAAAGRGEVGALLLVGEDPLHAWPPGLNPRAAVEGAGCVVVLDPFLSETARHADVVFPVAMLGERRGTLAGHDGVGRALVPAVPSGSLPQDGDLLAELGLRLGATPPPPAHRYAHGLTEGEGSLRFEPPHPPAALPMAGEGPMLLDSSPQLFHAGTVTARSQILASLAPPLAVGLHPRDAEGLGVASGEPVAVTDGRRELLLQVRVDGSVRPGTVRVLCHGGADSALLLLGEDGLAVRCAVEGAR